MQNYANGLLAEKKAIAILIKKNFTIIGQRIKSKFGEIDILAQYNNDYYIFEVKYRKNYAEYSIDSKQTVRSLKTFYTYAKEHNIHFDQLYFLAFIMKSNSYKIINIQNFDHIDFN